jgi:cytochrome d ubiquinol oxidase subunit I
MNDIIDTSLIDWSRAQFALTALYHWIFVPLTLGLAVIMGVMETIYFRTGDEFWKRTAKFWMRLFGVNFAIGVATGIILEFQFGTNWSNYSWFVGDIFGAPLAIEGILAFFMESTFIAVMFFGWRKVSRGFHLASTWLTGLGATISAWWILVANSWMQYPVGMEFNPATARNEMVNFAEVAFSPIAVMKFCHAVLNGWTLGAMFVIGVSCWYLLRKREERFALASIKIAAIQGFVAILLVLLTGDHSAVQVGRTQPMKLAAMEAYYEGETGPGLVAFGILSPDKKRSDDGLEPFWLRIEVPQMLSMLAKHQLNAFVPGINDVIKGGYTDDEGNTVPSIDERIESGKLAIAAFDSYRRAMNAGDSAEMERSLSLLRANEKNFGYGYVDNAEQLVPDVPLVFYSFRVMVYLGGYLIVYLAAMLFIAWRKDIRRMRWLQWVAVASIPLGYLAGMAGWIVAECGRQPWAIQDLLPTWVSISRLSTTAVQITFFIFLIMFTVMLAAGIRIMVREIGRGPEGEEIKPEI